MTIERPAGTRLERRKAQTRRKLIDAARVMLADGQAQNASIQDITEAADVGFGSFYNHFSSKSELFEIAVLDVMDEMGELLDSLGDLGDEKDDAAKRFARSIRLTARFGRARPELAKIVVRHGLEHLDSDRGVAFRAHRDIEAAVAAGQFRVGNARLALATTAGALLGTLQLSLNDPSQVDDAACDELAENLLRMFGVPARKAHTLATGLLPELPASTH
jgi:AcrR family transcriptional regulator